MKSIQLISLLFVCCLSLSTSAQTYFGIKMGGHLASFNVDEETGLDLNLSSKFGANFGIYMEIPLSGAFAIQPEISYISKGSSVEDIFFGGSSEKATIVFNNLDIHLLGKYTFGDEEFKAFITAGPTYGYTLKGFTKFGDEKENLLLQAEDEADVLDLNSPIAKPQRAQNSQNQYDSFFD